VVLIRAATDGGLIEKLSRYETILMNAVVGRWSSCDYFKD
jgi:hypothetical protein